MSMTSTCALTTSGLRRTKGGDERLVPIGGKAALALRRYLRARQRHAAAGSAALFLSIRSGDRGGWRISRGGVAEMLVRRCDAVGLPPVHPHMFRHTWANDLLSNGANEGDVEKLAGSRSPLMVRRYGASAASQRAQDSARRLARGTGCERGRPGPDCTWPTTTQADRSRARPRPDQAVTTITHEDLAHPRVVPSSAAVIVEPSLVAGQRRSSSPGATGRSTLTNSSSTASRPGWRESGVRSELTNVVVSDRCGRPGDRPECHHRPCSDAADRVQEVRLSARHAATCCEFALIEYVAGGAARYGESNASAVTDVWFRNGGVPEGECPGSGHGYSRRRCPRPGGRAVTLPSRQDKTAAWVQGTSGKCGWQIGEPPSVGNEIADLPRVGVKQVQGRCEVVCSVPPAEREGAD